MSNEKYNGWTNRETWLVNLHWGETIEEVFEEIDLQTLADCIEDFVWERLDEELTSNSIFRDFIDLHCVNWRELAEHYISE
jgi:exonuclease I